MYSVKHALVLYVKMNINDDEYKSVNCYLLYLTDLHECFKLYCKLLTKYYNLDV